MFKSPGHCLWIAGVETSSQSVVVEYNYTYNMGVVTHRQPTWVALENGTKDQNLRSPGGVVLTHARLTFVGDAKVGHPDRLCHCLEVLAHNPNVGYSTTGFPIWTWQGFVKTAGQNQHGIPPNDACGNPNALSLAHWNLSSTKRTLARLPPKKSQLASWQGT